MGKTKNKLKADVVVKNYWRNNEQFADFFNAVLYEGKQVIKPDELEDMDTEESYVSENVSCKIKLHKEVNTLDM